MNVGLLLIILMLVLVFLGIPICFSLGIATVVAMLYGGMPLLVVPQKMFTGVDSVPLLAIPFFLLAGNLMARGITQAILNFANAMIGAIRGGLGMVTVCASAVFAAISGSGVATVSAIGGMTIPAMKKEGYSPDFAAAVASVASILGPIIPPSIVLIVYGSSTDTSIGELFMAAVIPGLLVAAVLLGYVYYHAGKHNFKVHPKVSAKEKVRVTLDSIWALFMPVLILGGIFFGVFTATEAAAVSVLYALLVGLFIHKDLKLKELPKILSDSAVMTAAILMMLALSKVSSWVVVASKLPMDIMNTLSAMTDSPIVILLFLNGLLLIVGMLMEANAAVVMLTPLIIPLLKAYGISTVHFGIVMCLNLCIGLVTPPVGACILLGNEIAGEKLERTLVKALPMIGVSILVLMIVTYVPATTTWLPNLMK
ncbi:MAG: TRAP transporter large permease [Deltaproteobacteria bacterium]|jgi:C4-dicarboxylate transporter DctM subunit|nr:TRAP transporter large permease [Deltaproteobacteria bacterium]